MKKFLEKIRQIWWLKSRVARQVTQIKGIKPQMLQRPKISRALLHRSQPRNKPKKLRRRSRESILASKRSRINPMFREILRDWEQPSRTRILAPFIKSKVDTTKITTRLTLNKMLGSSSWYRTLTSRAARQKKKSITNLSRWLISWVSITWDTKMSSSTKTITSSLPSSFRSHSLTWSPKLSVTAKDWAKISAATPSTACVWRSKTCIEISRSTGIFHPLICLLPTRQPSSQIWKTLSSWSKTRICEPLKLAMKSIKLPKSASNSDMTTRLISGPSEWLDMLSPVEQSLAPRLIKLDLMQWWQALKIKACRMLTNSLSLLASKLSKTKELASMNSLLASFWLGLQTWKKNGKLNATQSEN